MSVLSGQLSWFQIIDNLEPLGAKPASNMLQLLRRSENGCNSNIVSQLPRLGQTFAKCDGSPQTKHLLPETGSPVAVTKAAPAPGIVPRPPLPRPPPLLEAEARVFARGTLLPPLPLLRLSSHTKKLHSCDGHE